MTTLPNMRCFRVVVARETKLSRVVWAESRADVLDWVKQTGLHEIASQPKSELECDAVSLEEIEEQTDGE